MTDNPRTVCIVTGFRCSSTSFTLLKAEEYGLTYCGEMFSSNRPHRLGEVPAAHEDAKLREQGHHVPSNTPRNFYIDWFISELRKGVPCCFKIMPADHVREHDKLLEILDACDKVIYLYRRDFRAQVKSWIAAQSFHDWPDNGFKRTTNNQYSFQWYKESILGTAGLAETVVRHVPKNHSLEDHCARQLMNGWKAVGRLYKERPSEVVCMEEYFSGDKYRPYNRKKIWDEEPDIPDFDVESIFK